MTKNSSLSTNPWGLARLRKSFAQQPGFGRIPQHLGLFNRGNLHGKPTAFHGKVTCPMWQRWYEKEVFANIASFLWVFADWVDYMMADWWAICQGLTQAAARQKNKAGWVHFLQLNDNQMILKRFREQLVPRMMGGQVMVDCVHSSRVFPFHEITGGH